MVILGSQNEITDFFMILAWASPFKEFLNDLNEYLDPQCGVKIDREIIMYLLFADDLIFFSQSAIGLQKQLNCFYFYCKL